MDFCKPNSELAMINLTCSLKIAELQLNTTPHARPTRKPLLTANLPHLKLIAQILHKRDFDPTVKNRIKGCSRGELSELSSLFTKDSISGSGMRREMGREESGPFGFLPPL